MRLFSSEGEATEINYVWHILTGHLHIYFLLLIVSIAREWNGILPSWGLGCPETVLWVLQSK